MTRLKAFAERLSIAVWAAESRQAARAVLEREVRSLLVNASVPLALAAWMATYLDEPAHPEMG